MATERAPLASVQNQPAPSSQQGSTQPVMYKVDGVAKSLFAKNSKGHVCSPTDNIMSPCTAKLSQAKKKHFNKGRPVSLDKAFKNENE